MIDDLIKYLTENKNEVIQFRDWMTSNNIDDNTESFNVSTEIGPANNDEDDQLNIDRFTKGVSNMLSSELDRFLTRKLMNCNIITYIQVNDSKPSYYNELCNLVDYINSKGYKQAFSNSYVTSLLIDSSLFKQKPGPMMGHLKGSIDDKINLYADPYLRWNETIMILFDKINVNISNIKFTKLLTNKILTEFDISYNIGCVEKILINTEFSSDEIVSEFTRINREKIIDSFISE